MVDVFYQPNQQKLQLVQATVVQQVPGTIEPSPFVDEDAAAVKQKHLEEVREEELSEMALHDRVAPKAIEIQEPEVHFVKASIEGGIFDDDGEMAVAHAPEPILQSQASASATAFLWMFHKLQMLVLKPL